jgi:hypothetical protein
MSAERERRNTAARHARKVDQQEVAILVWTA